MSASLGLGDALLFVTLALGVAIKREFIYVSYFIYFLFCLYLCLLFKSGTYDNSGSLYSGHGSEKLHLIIS